MVGDWEPAENPTCPDCGGEAVYLGVLGRWDWFKCRQCGEEFHA